MFIKGFDKDLKCRGFQFEIGGTYDTGFKDDELELCTDTVFHFCRSLQQVHLFYDCNDEDNRYCEIEVLGALIETNEKCGSNKIKIVREIIGDELNHLKGLERGNTGVFNSGDSNTGNFNSGDFNTGNFNSGDHNTGDFNTGNLNTSNGNAGHRNTGDCNTGDYNTGSCNTGDCNTGDCNTGYRNTGNYNVGYCNTSSYNTGNYNTGSCNTGYRNTGNCNTGYFNTGNYNTGNRNTGNCNTGYYNNGDYNTGDCNIGMFNSCNYSNGLFNTKEPTINIFNIDSGMTISEFKESEYYHALMSSPFRLTKWIEYSKEEKKTDKKKELIGGYLKKYTFYEACANWWNKMSDENKEIIKSIPNFDAKIFKEITGIEI